MKRISETEFFQVKQRNSFKLNNAIYVKDSNNPISGANVSSTSQPSGQSALSGTTDNKGYLAFNDLKPGTYMIGASKSGYDADGKNATVKDGQTTTLTITLSKITPKNAVEGKDKEKTS